MKNKILISSLVVGLVSFAGVLGLQKVRAEDTNNFSPLIQRIVEKFNLNKDEVSGVVSNFRGEQQKLRQQDITDRLAQAVKDGKITEDQKNTILAKVTEWQSQMGTMNSLTVEERRTKMNEHRTEMQEWEKNTGIDLQGILGKGAGGTRGLGMGMMGRGFGDEFGQGSKTGQNQ